MIFYMNLMYTQTPPSKITAPTYVYLTL